MTSQWVLGYYVGYQIDRCSIESIPWSCLTHIAFGPLKVKTSTDATGKSVVTLVTDFDDSHGEGVSDALKVSDAAHAHGVKALLMFGGAGESKSIGEAASDPHRKTLIGELLTLMEKLGYDGIDLDWEDDKDLKGNIVAPVVKSDLVALAKGLRDAKSDIILTFPAPAVNPNDSPHNTEQLEFKKVTPYVDKFSVMTYTGTYTLGSDWASWFVSPLTGDDKAHFPVSIDQNLKLWTEDSMTKDGTTVKGVPKDKLLMGIGAFAICYPPYITEALNR